MKPKVMAGNNMKLQLSPQKIVKDHLTVWHEHGSEVDIVMDLKNLTFAPDSIESLCAFHVADHFFEDETRKAFKNWYECLKQNGTLYVVVDNFELIARKFVGGDINISMINERFSHPMQFTKDNLILFLSEAGFIDHEMRIWYADIPEMFTKGEYDFVIAAKKI